MLAVLILIIIIIIIRCSGHSKGCLQHSVCDTKTKSSRVREAGLWLGGIESFVVMIV